MCELVGLIMLGTGPLALAVAGLVLYGAVRRLRASLSEAVLETIQPAIEESVKRQDDRIEKRSQRAKPTEPGPAETWERQMHAGQPYNGREG